MIKTFGKILCAVAVMASHGWAAENSIEFNSEHFKYISLTVEDKPEFEELSMQHNAQENVPIVEGVFDNHVARRNAGNAWHMLMVRDLETNELVAALSMGRIPSVVEKYNPESHADILAYFQTLGVINEDKTRIDDKGIGHYILMADMEKMNSYLTELHTTAFAHCQILSETECLLPIEKTRAAFVGLFVRPGAPDTAAMTDAGYRLTYTSETSDTPNESRWYADKITNVWTQEIR
ncbi:MAG: hypothetical protein NWR39_02540 [Pseudomonadota bacterium]|nr:hypothetical protein [Alphaproteobacteria bacterium]MDP5370434.1 hypothetical protein [Pseudomonadota bacterium]